MKMLITGANGHIGGVMVRHFHSCGENITATSRGPVSNLPENINYLSLDISHPVDCANLPQFDAIIHAAADIGTNTVQRFDEVNVLGTSQLMDIAIFWKSRAFIYFSSMSVLGDIQLLPIREDHPACPNTPYGRSKLDGEVLTLKQMENFDTCVSLRITSPVGPGLKHPRIFRLFVEKALRNEDIVLDGVGGRRQNYVDVRDIAAAVEASIQHKAKGIFNIGAEHTLSNLELAQACIKTLNSKSEIRFSGLPDPQEKLDWNISLEKAKSLLGYQPVYSIEDSITALTNEIN